MPDESSEPDEQLVLSDLLNHVLDRGVVISGHVAISIANIDLIYLDLRLVLTSAQSLLAREGARREDGDDAHVPLLLPPDPA